MNFQNLRDRFWDTIYLTAKQNRNVVIVSADLGAIALDKFREELPAQFINTGIAEQNAITVAAGLALQGKRVYIYACAPFIHMRCYEQIRLTASGMNLPITIVGQGAGFSFWEFGPTHHITEDLGSMRLLPNIKTYVMSDLSLTEQIANYTLTCSQASYIRMDKLAPPPVYNETKKIDIEKGFEVFGNSTAPLLLIGCGNTTHMVRAAAQELMTMGINCSWMDLYCLQPNLSEFIKVLKRIRAIVTVEEHGIFGGLGSLLSELMVENEIYYPLCKIACDTRNGYWYHYGSRQSIEKHYGLSMENIIEKAKEVIKKIK